MAFPTSISSAEFSALSVASGAVPSTLNEANLVAMFGLPADFDEIKNIRDMPSVGTPANIIKVPVYGQATTQSIGAQSDAPDLDLVVNYIPGEWAPGTTLGDYVKDGVSKVFQLSFLVAKPASLVTTAAGLGTVPNYNIYFVGKIESKQENPMRDDAVTANISLSIQSEFYGPYTID